MFSSWCCLHRKSIEKDYQGPTSLYVYEYRGKKILLIGENHWGSERHCYLSTENKQQYSHVFNNYIDNNIRARKQVKIYLEHVKKDKIEAFESWGFIDCLLSIEARDNLEVVAADNRRWHDGITALFGTLVALERLEKRIREEVRKCTRNAPTSIPFDERQVDLVRDNKLIFLDEEKLMLSQLFELFTKQLDDIISLRKIFNEQPIVLELLERSYVDLHDGFTELNAIIEENGCVGERELQNITIEELCVQMMLNAKNFSPVARWFGVLSKYVGGHLDATLISRLWCDMNNDKSAETIIMVAGQLHIESIAACLKQLCNETYCIVQPKHSPPISPIEFNQCLCDERFDHGQGRQCVIM